VYNIQRLYLTVLEALDIRESTIPGTPARAELVMYQLGKFSQVISDFESINFASDPERKYQGFVRFLTDDRQAPSYYEESDGDAGYATPDAVTITTVHRAKGMQWPAVFVPCLRKNRFPIRSSGGINLFHVIPIEAVPNGARYRGGRSEETRLLYVAVTRAQKYLYLTWAPIASNQQARARSDFFRDAAAPTGYSPRTPACPTCPGSPRPQRWRRPPSRSRSQSSSTCSSARTNSSCASCTASTLLSTRRSATARACTTLG